MLKAPKSNLSIPLREKLDRKKKELIQLDKQIERLVKLLRDPELEDDETFKEDYKSSKAKRIKINSEIEELQIKVLEIENETRNSRTKTLIETYTDDIQFDEIKRLVHSLIESIKIHHAKQKKSGYYFLVIKYKNYSEESTFTTDWKALTWNWNSYYREKALNEEQLSEDIELLKADYERKGIPFSEEDLISFEGNTSVSGLITDSIELNPNELILFD